MAEAQAQLARAAPRFVTLLDRYIARTLLSAVALVMAVLAVLGALFVFIGEQGDVGVGHYGMLDALAYAAMSVPQFALESFPAGALVGALLGVGVLARSHELTVMRASGMSKLRLAAAAMISAGLLIGVALLMGEFLAQPLGQLADEQKAFAKYSNISFAGAGAWIRDGDTILNVQGRSSVAQFGGMLIFDLAADNRLAAIGHAEHARALGAQSGSSKVMPSPVLPIIRSRACSLPGAIFTPQPVPNCCSSPSATRPSWRCTRSTRPFGTCATMIWMPSSTSLRSGRASRAPLASWPRCCLHCHSASAPSAPPR